MPPTSPGQRPSRAVLVLLLLASFTLITLDARNGDDSPLDPVRSAVGSVFGPVENGTAAAGRPFKAGPSFFPTTRELGRGVGPPPSAKSPVKNPPPRPPVGPGRAPGR